jgi:glutaredoxin-like YruB-family protein
MTDLTIYTQPSCGYCNELKNYLKKHNIPYQEKDITKDRSAFEDLVHKYKIRATPLIVYGEKTVVGFNPEEIQKMIGEPQAAEAR